MAAASAERFERLTPALSEAALKAIASLGFERATPVQAATIPLFLSHKDVCVQAVTGSGKTLSFAIPVFEMLAARREALKPHDVGALILAPTRELAQQIHGVLARIGAFYPRLSLALLVSGQEAARSDAALLRGGCNIAVGTPGRVEATLKRVREFNVRTLEVLVLDEADRLLDAGFAASVTFILQRLPKQRRTGLFSATQTREVEELARAGMRNPVRVDVAVQYKRRAAPEPPAAAAAAAAAAPSRKRGAAASTEGGGDTQATPATLRNFYVVLPPAAKLGALAAFLAAHAQRKVIVFFLTCAQVEYFARLLPQLGALAGLRFSALHGQMEARRRERAYQAFLEQPSGVLLATDVAARGIDVPDVHWIVQFDAPLDPSFFVHRIGRTARMGKEGAAVILLAPSEEHYVTYLRKQQVPLDPLPDAPAPAEDAAVAEARALALRDRDLLERCQRALVSFFRAYKEHRLRFVLPLETLDLGGVARGYGALLFPRMPDLKKLPVIFDAPPVDTAAIPYKDAARERQRLTRLREAAELRDRERRERLKRKREAERAAQPRRRDKAKRRAIETEREWGELQLEERLLKRLKRGDISEAQFERLLRGDGVDEDEEEEEQEQGAAEQQGDEASASDPSEDAGGDAEPRRPARV